MVHVEGVARLVANLVSIAVQIVGTSCLARLVAYPVLLSSTNYCSSIVDTLAFLLGVVVREPPKDAVVS